MDNEISSPGFPVTNRASRLPDIVRSGETKGRRKVAKFAYMLTFGPNVEERLATRPAHREYLAGLLESGKLVASGPFVDDSGALIIYEANDEAEARELIANDPYTGIGVAATATLKEWKQVYPAS
jgi:uncharacterized protein